MPPTMLLLVADAAADAEAGISLESLSLSSDFRRVTPRDPPQQPARRRQQRTKSGRRLLATAASPSPRIRLDGQDIRFADVQVLGELGRGAYGSVCKCTHGGGRGLAMKVVDSAADPESGADSHRRHSFSPSIPIPAALVRWVATCHSFAISCLMTRR